MNQLQKRQQPIVMPSTIDHSSPATVDRPRKILTQLVNQVERHAENEVTSNERKRDADKMDALVTVNDLAVMEERNKHAWKILFLKL